MNPADLLRAVRQIALDTNLVAMDVVEWRPRTTTPTSP